MILYTVQTGYMDYDFLIFKEAKSFRDEFISNGVNAWIWTRIYQQ